MDMGTEFINAYIAKMKASLDDFLARNIMLDTQLDIATRTIVQLQTEKDELIQQIETLKVKQAKVKKTEDNTF
jgi:cell division protein FtsB